MIRSRGAVSLLPAIALVALVLPGEHSFGAIITDSSPTASKQSADPFGLPGSGLSSDYFGVPVITDNVSPALDDFLIDGTPTNLSNSSEAQDNWPSLPLPGGPSPVIGRDLNHINPDGNGNQDFAGETATWSVTVPAGVTVTSVDFTVEAVIREQEGVIYESSDTLTFVLSAPGSALDSGSQTLDPTTVHRVDQGGNGAYAFPSSSLFSDAAVGFATAAPTEYSVVFTVGDFEAGAEGFWTAGVLSVEYTVIPEPTAALLSVFAVVGCAAKRWRRRRNAGDRKV